MEKEDKLKIIDDLDHFLKELVMYRIFDLQIAILHHEKDGHDVTQAQSNIEALSKRYDDINTKLQSLRADINGEDWQSSEDEHLDGRWVESTC